MCNEYSYLESPDRLIEEVSRLKIPLVFPGGIPNYPPRESIRINDTAPVLRATGDGAALINMKCAWKAPTGKPVFNFRSDGRRFAVADRVLIPMDGFYEFTAPADPKQKRKDRWLFTLPEKETFAVAGIVRDSAFAMLTTEPGKDIKPYHDRQIVVVRKARWADWLLGRVAEAEVLKPCPAGSLQVKLVQTP